MVVHKIRWIVNYIYQDLHVILENIVFHKGSFTEWNNLDNGMIESETVTQFKNWLDKYMKARHVLTSLVKRH